MILKVKSNILDTVTKKPSEPVVKESQRLTFDKVLKQLKDIDSLLHNTNCTSRLLNESYAINKHIGYYDEIRDGIIFVKDCITGELIRKDNSVLTDEGNFISKNSDAIFKFSEEDKKDIFALKVFGMENTDVTERFKNMYIKNTEYAYFYEKVDLDKCKIIIDAVTFKDCFNEVFYQNNRDIQTIKSNKVLERLLFSRRYFNISFRDINTHDYNNIYVTDCSRFALVENQSRTSFKWNYLPETNLNSLSKLEVYNVPVYEQKELCVLNTVPVRSFTYNNEGKRMDHFSKVTDYKTCFMVTPEEKLRFEQVDKDDKNPLHRPIYMGIELEVVPRRFICDRYKGYQDVIRTIANTPMQDHVIMTRDGSLGDNGIEIVTVPATLAYHRKMFTENFFSNKNILSSIMANPLCGLHVHVSKNVLTTAKWGQVMFFVNDLANAKFMQDVSTRAPNSYCRREDSRRGPLMIKRACSNQNIRNGLSRLDQEKSDARYVILNTQNAHTMEFRCFKSTIDKNNFFHKLEFVEALVQFVRQASLKETTLEKFIDFVLDINTKKSYPHLIRWLASKNYIGHTYKRVKATNRLVHSYSGNLLKDKKIGETSTCV